MKRIIFIFVALLFSTLTFGQDQLYAIVELMEVDNEQETAYAQTEEFWQKIHQQRVNSGEIIGWDLWQLLPGGEDQGYQYATVTLYSSKAGMFKGGDWWGNAKKAYPNMSDSKLNDKLDEASKTRDLAVRIYLERIARTEDDFKLEIGSMATFAWMKVDLGEYAPYESAEKQIFQPLHQKDIENGHLGSWSLMRYVSPIGSDTYASHVAVNMYKDADQLFSEWEGEELPMAQQMGVMSGLDTRDMKMVHIARLIRKVRK